MPRVHKTVRSTRAVKRPFICNGCGKEIVAGEEFYNWEKRYGGVQRRHVACGYPKLGEMPEYQG